MSKKGKHGVRNPKRTKPNPYSKRRPERGGWGTEPRDYGNRNNSRWADEEPEYGDEFDERDDEFEDYDDDEGDR